MILIKKDFCILFLHQYHFIFDNLWVINLKIIKALKYCLKDELNFQNMIIHLKILYKFNLEYNSLIDKVFRMELMLDFNGIFDHPINHNLKIQVF
jgi:hypothetical protein